MRRERRVLLDLLYLNPANYIRPKKSFKKSQEITWLWREAARIGEDNAKAARFTPSSRLCQVNYLALGQKNSPTVSGEATLLISIAVDVVDKINYAWRYDDQGKPSNEILHFILHLAC